MTTAFNVVVIEPGYANYDMERRALEPVGASISALDWQGDRQKLYAGVADADIIMLRDTFVDASVLDAARRLKGLVRYGVGLDRIDLDAARARRIMVANVPDYGADIEVADHTLALFLAVRRRIVTRDKMVRNGAWEVGQKEPMIRIAGSTLGLIGYGRIARAVHRRFAAFGVEDVLVHDPYLSSDDAAGAGVKAVPLGDLVEQSDIVSLHAPGSPANRPTLDAGLIARMRAGAIVLNTARGTHIDEDALGAAIGAGKLAGAGLDVFCQEPPGANHPLFSFDQVVVSDHTGWYSEQSVRQIQSLASEEALRMLSGKKPNNWVNRW
ncbi:C-terminal binding protein [Corticibacterium sp. UT-5YL-CI-8]|nr:C-terminal binding protein [Tianweitania sp. UT-5YL-CI-8]